MVYLPKKVTVKEVGPRDGLQNEKKQINTDDKVKWINMLSHTGLSFIEVTSFVHPKWIPSLADCFEVAKKIDRVEGVTYSALVPNQKGLEKALAAEIDEIAIFMSASETHNQHNVNRSREDSFAILKGVINDSLTENKKVRGYISTVFGCPYEGAIEVAEVLRICEKLFSMGVYEISLGDTIGVATPKQVNEVLSLIFREFPEGQFAMHFHNTRGTALANVNASLELGITSFDSSLGGLGGCPYAPGASGNVATDDLYYLLNTMGIQTGIEEKKLKAAVRYIQEKIGRRLDSHSSRLLEEFL
ncbi:hydroxymethylglutaryl-CoA lyase [Bacillus weihaiensis]|uniref:Hydroxymethylglutaryl-CoA lyase n=1 Tax=Bacillus weihaiensis TaxID=1547283 RepID=A0A1L3MR73_9BACI|nr:hydroxymethylglutaryl-CoA lyase [Bacillus weihaiensis]APH04843.1 hydroxymethylglutaryl-CoA lyase [Bacillus weihaiensis]